MQGMHCQCPREWIAAETIHSHAKAPLEPDRVRGANGHSLAPGRHNTWLLSSRCGLGPVTANYSSGDPMVSSGKETAGYRDGHIPGGIQ